MALGGGGGGARDVEAGKAFVRLGVKDDMTGPLKKLAGRFMAFGKLVAATGALAVGGGLALGIAGITAAAGPLVETIQELGKIQDVADAFGTTGKAASGLLGVLGAVGGEFKENLEGIIQFSGQVDKAVKGIGTGQELFDGLAVSAQDIATLPIDEQFYRVLGAIRQLPQPLQEAKLALIGGSDSMKQWQALLTMSNDQVRQLADKLAFSNSELRQAAEASKAYKAATGSVTRAWQQVAVTVAPLVKEIAQWVEKAADGFTAWIKGRSAGNILAEVWVRIKQGLFEIQAFGEDVFSALWDYFSKNAGPAMEVVKQLFAGLFKFAVGGFAKIFPIWTKYAAAGAAATLGTVATLLKTAGMTKEGDELFAAAKSIDPTKAAAHLAEQQEEGIAELNKALEGFEAERKKFNDGLAERQRQRAGERQGVRDELAAELRRVQDAAELERRQAEVIDGMIVNTPAGGRQAKVARMGRALGTFGTGFLGQAYGVQSADKDVGKLLNEGNKEAKKQTGLLAKIADKSGLVVT